MKAITPIYLSPIQPTALDNEWFQVWSLALAELDASKIDELSKRPHPVDEVLVVLGLGPWASQMIGLLNSPLLSLNQKDNPKFLNQVRRCMRGLTDAGCSPNAVARRPALLPSLHQAPLYVAACLPINVSLKIIEALVEVGADPAQAIVPTAFGPAPHPKAEHLIDVLLRTSTSDVSVYLTHVVEVENDRRLLSSIADRVDPIGIDADGGCFPLPALPEARSPAMGSPESPRRRM